MIIFAPMILIMSMILMFQPDSSLWQRVYSPNRLTVLDSNKTVKGIVRNIRQEADGDLHIELIPDKGQQGLTNPFNHARQHDCLVLEIICSGARTQKDAIGPCGNYYSTIKCPLIGQHISVTGAFVLDRWHGWLEIHPVKSITPL